LSNEIIALIFFLGFYTYTSMGFPSNLKWLIVYLVLESFLSWTTFIHLKVNLNFFTTRVFLDVKELRPVSKLYYYANQVVVSSIYNGSEILQRRQPVKEPNSTSLPPLHVSRLLT